MPASRCPRVSRSSRGSRAWSSARSRRSSRTSASRPRAITTASAASRCPTRDSRSSAARPMPPPGLRTAFAPRARRCPAAAPSRPRRSAARSPRACSAPSWSSASARTRSGILELPADAPLGAPLTQYLGLDDSILEIEITPNRPDALSVVGVAREVAALTGAPFRFPQIAVKEGETEAAIARDGRDPRPRSLPALRRARHHRSHGQALAAVARPAAARGGPAPDQQPRGRDELRPLGDGPAAPRLRLRHDRPAHASSCGARSRASGSRTLDGQERALEPDMLMICDPERAVGHRRRHGRRQHRGDGRHDDGAARERLLQPRLRPPDLARARAPHRRRVPLRARRRHRRAPRGPRPRRPAHGRSGRRHRRQGRHRRLPGAEAPPAHRASPLAHRAAHRRLPAPRGGREDPPGAGLRRG